MESFKYKQTEDNMRRVSRLFARFGRTEDGTITVMTLTFLVLMLIVGGMAVDFMRYESKRAMLQSTADRAVLAAANLTQDKTPKSVVIDYFTKAGFADSIVYPIAVDDRGNYTSVGVNAKLNFNTFFLKFLGINELQAPAAATAVEGVADIEVSLVVDISGSMRDPVADGSETKIVALRRAAGKFVDAILLPEYAGNISISLVPYSDQVNAGPDLFAALNTNSTHSFSHCIEFTDTELGSLAIDAKPATYVYNQTQHFQFNGDGVANSLTDTICPRYSGERIVPFSQNATTLKGKINQLQPRAGTAIHLGLKWGLALLDSSMRPAISSLISQSKVDAGFQGRPANYPVQGSALNTQKVIVLMTDGQNDFSYRFKPEFYDSLSEVAFWANNNLWYFVNREFGGKDVMATMLTQRYFRDDTDSNALYGPKGGTNGDVLMQNMCTLAKAKETIIYAIAVESGVHGANEMADCASSPSHFFSVDGNELDSVFEGIAKQITELRLSL